MKMKNLTKLLTVAGLSLGLSFCTPSSCFSQIFVPRNYRSNMEKGYYEVKGDKYYYNGGSYLVPAKDKGRKINLKNRQSSDLDLGTAAAIVGGFLLLDAILDDSGESTKKKKEKVYESSKKSYEKPKKEKTYEKWWKEDSESKSWYQEKDKNEWYKKDSKNWYEEKTADGLSLSVPRIVGNNKKRKYNAGEFFFEEPNTKAIGNSGTGFAERTGETFKWLFVQPFTGISETFEKSGSDLKKEEGTGYNIAGSVSKSIGELVPRTPAGLASLALGNIKGSVLFETAKDVASEVTEEGGLEEYMKQQSENSKVVFGESNKKHQENMKTGLYILSSHFPGASDILEGIEEGINTEKDIRRTLE